MQKLSMSNVNIVENSVDDFISPHGHLTIDKLAPCTTANQGKGRNFKD